MSDPLELQDLTDRHELGQGPAYRFAVSRRGFIQTLGAGIVIGTVAGGAIAQRLGQGGMDERSIGARLIVGEDGRIHVFTSKVEVGQGARTQLAQAAAEELRVPVEQVELVMADTDACPDDGGTYGSRTTPANVPEVRAAAAATRELLLDLAAQEWNVPRESLRIEQGVIRNGAAHHMSFADFAKAGKLEAILKQRVPNDTPLTPLESWTVLGQPKQKPTGRAIVTGKLRFPSDIRLPGTLYAKVLRPPKQGATLESVDVNVVTPSKDLVVVHEGPFVGCAAITSKAAAEAIAAIAAAAKWTETPQPSSAELDAYFRANQRPGGGRRGSRTEAEGDVEAVFASSQAREATYAIPYIQHVPMETRAALAHWEDGKLSVWTGTQRPDGVRDELAEAFSLPAEKVRVVVLDTGGGFGGKHSGECAVEAARLAKAAQRPVSLQWTREEEFCWAYSRPAAVIDIRAALGEDKKVGAWEFTNFNAGSSGIDYPYVTANKRIRYVATESPLKQGSYRALASTGNNFARECFMDELAHAAEKDPLEFRLAQLEDERMRVVLEEVANRFRWQERRAQSTAGTGVGIACGTEKGSYVATCAEVRVAEDKKSFEVIELCQAFECGAVQNPLNCNMQMEGGVIMGLGGALMEEMLFEGGVIQNASLKKYRVPRLSDVPKLDLVLVNRPEIKSVGAGETPIIGVAPAIGNAIFAACGVRLRKLPLRL